MRLFVKLTLATAVLAPTFPLLGDTLLLDVIAEEPPNNPHGLLRPTRGMSMDGVRRHFGDPDQTLPWVGDPPITRWVYDAYTVYFENDRVITTVLNR